MHELGVVLEVLDLVAARSGGAPVRKIVLEIGQLCAVLPQAVRFAFELAREDTVAAGAELVIVQTPGRARCRRCAAELALERPYGACACGNTDLEWLEGDELRVQSLEVA